MTTAAASSASDEAQRNSSASTAVEPMDQQHTREVAAHEESIVPETQLNLETYQFPAERLRRKQIHEDRTPLVLVACGSFR